MALFPWSKNKTPALPGPSAELPWTLTVGVDRAPALIPPGSRWRRGFMA